MPFQLFPPSSSAPPTPVGQQGKPVVLGASSWNGTRPRPGSVPSWAAALLLGLAACGPSRSEPAPRVRELKTPSLPGSGEPNLCVTPDGRMLLSWIEPAGEKTHRLRFSARAQGGEWSEPRTVAEGSDFFVNWADFPSLAALPDGRLFAQWLARSGPGTYAYDVRIAVSRDGGTSWAPALTPHLDGTPTEHGFVSLFPWDRDRLGVAWLDGRKTAARSGHGHGGTEAEMTLMHTTVGPDGRLGDEVLLDGRVCDCCQTSAVRTERGAIVVYRNRSEKEVRDISFVRYVDGRWSEPQTLAADGWEINGCPVNGPAIAAEGRRAAVAWFAAPGDEPRVRVAFSADAGETWSAPLSVDDGRPIGRVDIVLLPRGGALVSWMEQTTKGAELRARRVSPDGARGPMAVVADSSAARSSGFPRMEAGGGEVVFAWRDPAEPPRVRTAVLEN